MAGGTFDKSVGKVRPGTYINFTSTKQDSISGSQRGTVILPPANTDYGPAGEMISLTASSPDAAITKLGYSVYDNDPSGNMLLIREAFKGANAARRSKKLINCKGSTEYWAHVLWQRHHLRMEDFCDMPRKMQLFYIASEICENNDPCRYILTREKRRR